MRIIHNYLFVLLCLFFFAGNIIAQEYTILNRSFEENQIVISGTSNIILSGSIGRTVTGTIESDNLILRTDLFVHYVSNGDSLTNITGNKSVSREYSLSQNYPNPFNPSTKIIYSVAAESNVNITIYNMLGERVKTLVDRTMSAGEYEVTWNAQNFSNGVYFCVMKSGEYMDSKKIILLK